jgi:hypothetical protein
MKTLLVAGAFACLCVPAFSAECEFPYDDTIGQLAAAGAPVVEVPADALPDLVERIEGDTGQEYGDVQRGFIAQAGGKILLGLEVDDCLLPPIIVGTLAPTSAPLSGKDEAGRIGA